MIDEEMGNLLAEEIKNQIRNISTLSPEKKSKAIDDLATLYKVRIDDLKAHWDFETKWESIERDVEVRYESMNRESAQKNEQMNEQKKDRWIGLGLGAAGIVLPLIFYGIWMRKGLKFEEKGTYTSTTFRGLINRFRPTKY